MVAGTNGKILHVDLTGERTWDEEVADAIYRRYLGGGAMACYFLLRDLKADAGPFSPDNLLAFTTSVICGLPLSGTNRFTAAAKSPLTLGYGESEAGGWWGPELKAAGYDAVLLHGRASKPAYLFVHDGKAELRDASRYWGKLSGEVQDGLVEELGDKRIRVLQCGVAGENRVRFAAIVNELR
ncbi:MAG: aldehyde ferredoxin oxidoreductase, partial [Armatimonadetes bacterium]|nr:aldehyde ferredoxin oxidoreductase [Armatimonadota bacterium]